MPSSSRLDAPGVLRHIMIRGIERGNMFRNDKNFRQDYRICRIDFTIQEVTPNRFKITLHSGRIDDTHLKCLRGLDS